MKVKFEFFPKELIKNKQLTPSDKIVYLHFFHISGWNEDKTINISNLAEKLGINRKSIQRAITKLELDELIKVNSDKTFKVYLAGSEIKSKNFLKNKLATKMAGDFIKVPTQFLYDTNLTPAERISAMMLFDFYFDIDEKGNFINRGNVILQSVATYYGINISTFKEHIQNLKKKGAIDYTVITNKVCSKIYGFKFYKRETITVYCNGKTTKKDNIKIETKEETIQPTEEVKNEYPEGIHEYSMPDYDWDELVEKECDRYDCHKPIFQRKVKRILTMYYDGEVTIAMRKLIDREYNEVSNAK